jgi:hypothetical protein
MPVNNPDLKRQQCEAKHPNGYRVIDIWESEWDGLKKHLAKSNKKIL